MTFPATSAWCLAASLGWIPPSSGMKALMMLARTFPLEVRMPTLKSSAVDSIPNTWDLRLFGVFGKCFRGSLPYLLH